MWDRWGCCAGSAAGPAPSAEEKKGRRKRASPLRNHARVRYFVRLQVISIHFISLPSGPGIHLRFEAPQVDWPPVDDQETVTPVPIVAIGHFDDPAAATCPPEDATWCHDLFIIDNIAWAYGNNLGFAGRINDANVKSTPDEIAQAIAPTWERRRADIEEVAAPVRSWLVHALDPRPGDTVLELAAGNGDTGFDAALHIGSRGTLLTTDFSPAMLESARRRARTLALENVKFLVIDAQHIELEDDSVDGVICRYGYMLMVDPWAALTETRRVLRPGGRLVLAVWGPPAKNPFFTAAVGPLVAAHHLPAPDPDGPGVFALADRADLSALLLTAGFDEARIQEVAVRFTLPDVAAYLAASRGQAENPGP